MFSDFKCRIRAFFASKQDIIDWYSDFAPAYDRISWQAEIILKAEATRRRVIKRSNAYPHKFICDIMGKFAKPSFGDMLPRFAGSGRKKAVYAFGRRVVVKLAIARNALAGDLAVYEYARKRGLQCMPRLIVRSPAGTSMLCEYARPFGESDFDKQFGTSCKRVCRLLGLCVDRESPSSEAEARLVEKTEKRLGPVYASLNDMQILTSGIFSEDIIGNEDNQGIIKRNGTEIPVLLDCGE